MNNTTQTALRINGRLFAVSRSTRNALVTDAAGTYLLRGSHGATYATVRSGLRMSLVSARGPVLGGVYLSDADGALRVAR